MTFRFLFLSLAVLAFGEPVLRAQPIDPTALKKSMLAEWKSLAESANTWRSVTEVKWYSSAGDKPMRYKRRDVSRIAFSPKGASWSYRVEDFDDQMKAKLRTEEMHLVNSDYKATLEKSKDRNSWVLTDIVQPTPPEALENRTGGCQWLVCGNVFLPDWIADDRFVITRIELRDNAAAGDVVRVHFRHDPTRKKAGAPELDHGIDNGWIDFDRSRHYCVLGYRYERRSSVSDSAETGTFQYGDDVDGIPVLEKIVEETPPYRNRQHDMTLQSRTERTFKTDYNASVPEEEFRLSHYGLPEPMGVTWRPPTPMYVWFLLGAGIAAVLAVGFRFLARRTKKTV